MRLRGVSVSQSPLTWYNQMRLRGQCFTISIDKGTVSFTHPTKWHIHFPNIVKTTLAKYNKI